MSLEAIATKLDHGIAELRAGTLQESTLAAIRDELTATLAMPGRTCCTCKLPAPRLTLR